MNACIHGNRIYLASTIDANITIFQAGGMIFQVALTRSDKMQPVSYEKGTRLLPIQLLRTEVESLILLKL